VRACTGVEWVSLAPKALIGSELNPGKTCKEILDQGGSKGDGIYWIDHLHDGIGNKRQAYCDMTQAGGGWELIVQRRAGSTNTSSGDVNLNTFLRSVRGGVEALGYGDSYSVDVGTIPPRSEYLFVQYASNMAPDLDDAFIIHHTGELFPNTTGPSTPAVSKICDVNNASCDTSGVYFVYAGDSWFHSSTCYDGYANNTAYRGNYGYCHNGLSGGYNSNSLYGNRVGYDETKLWAHGSSSEAYMERVFIR
jgi:hypothetical protein